MRINVADGYGNTRFKSEHFGHLGTEVACEASLRIHPIAHLGKDAFQTGIERFQKEMCIRDRR